MVYLARDIPVFVTYRVNGESGSALLIESTESMIINPRRACAARVSVVALCVCMYVCMCVSTHESYLPPHTLESQKSDTNRFCVIQGSF